MFWNAFRNTKVIAVVTAVPRANFFSKIVGELTNSNQNVTQIIHRANDSFNSEYLDTNYTRYLHEMTSILPLNSYNNNDEKLVEPKLFSNKTIFRLAGQSVFDEWAQQYIRIVDAVVESDMGVIEEICEANLAQKFEALLKKIDKSSLAFVKVQPQNPLVYMEFENHHTIEGVSLHRHKNLHASQYFQTSDKDYIRYDKVSAKKQSNWALFNLSSKSDIEKDEDGEYLHLNQYFISLQTNIRLNLVKKQEPSTIIYGSDSQTLLARHLLQIENVRGRSDRKVRHWVTDIDSILNGNPLISMN